jgi:NAD(P)-dependent dehydrogenase (short-subunit alcohol dehydrogenase family)
MDDVIKRICMVTGANRGIGKATAIGLAERGAHVVMVCRSQKRGEEARREIVAATGNERVDLLLADLSTSQALRDLAHRFLNKYERLDVLVNNHTAIFERRELSSEGIEMNFALNYLSYFHLTTLLLDALRASDSGRVVTLAAELHRSGTIDFDDLFFEEEYHPVRAYAQAKLGNVLFTYELARRLEGTQVVANCLHPGSIDTHALRSIRAVHSQLTGTKLSDYPPPGTLEEGAETPLFLAISAEVEGVSGCYFVDRKPVPSSDASYDRDLAERLWTVSEELIRRGQSG